MIVEEFNKVMTVEEYFKLTFKAIPKEWKIINYIEQIYYKRKGKGEPDIISFIKYRIESIDGELLIEGNLDMREALNLKLSRKKIKK